MLITQNSTAQEQSSPEIKTGFLFPFGYKFQLPAADLSDRFGFNSSIYGGLYYKNASNWVYGAESSFIFGNRIVDNSLINSYVFTSGGSIIGADGYPADIFFFERGLEISARVGKLIPMLKNNSDSGLFLQGGIGFLQHKIHIDQRGNAVVYLQGEYAKGIDRLTNGVMLTQYIGYMHLGRRWTNFNIGIEAMEGFTKNRRAYNYDEMRAETETRLDILLSIRFGLILPVYNKKDNFFYD